MFKNTPKKKKQKVKLHNNPSPFTCHVPHSWICIVLLLHFVEQVECASATDPNFHWKQTCSRLKDKVIEGGNKVLNCAHFVIGFLQFYIFVLRSDISIPWILFEGKSLKLLLFIELRDCSAGFDQISLIMIILDEKNWVYFDCFIHKSLGNTYIWAVDIIMATYFSFSCIWNCEGRKIKDMNFVVVGIW